MLNCRDAFISNVRAQITEDQARRFYEEDPDRFDRQDIVELNVTVWNNGGVTESVERIVTEDNVRQLHERYDDIMSASLHVNTGENTLVERDDGTFVQIHCVKRTESGQYPFNEVRAAAAQQCAHMYVEELIDDRVKKLR